MQRISSSASSSALPIITRTARRLVSPRTGASPGGGVGLGGRTFLVPAATPAAVSGPTLEKATMGEDQTKSSNDQPGVSGGKQYGNLAAGIIPHLLNLYNLKSSAADYDIYAPDASFEDPLMRANGVKQIKSAFYSMPKVFKEGYMGEYEVQETETEPGSGEIAIDNTQHYKIWGKDIDVKSLIKLQIKDGKIIRHEDLWDKSPLWNRDTVKVPLVGRATEGLRKCSMLLTHALMGCGKDPAPRSS